MNGRNEYEWHAGIAGARATRNAARLAEWRRVAPVMCVDNGPGRASFRFRLGRFFPSRVVHVGDAALADALALADRYRRCVGFERRRNTVGRPSRFAGGEA